VITDFALKNTNGLIEVILVLGDLEALLLEGLLKLDVLTLPVIIPASVRIVVGRRELKLLYLLHLIIHLPLILYPHSLLLLVHHC
jgi:hypothetical protein